MKKLLKVLPLVILFCFNPDYQQGKEVTEQTMVNIESEQVKVQLILEQYIKALTTKNMELLSKIFAHDEDMVMFDGNISKRFVGWKALKGRFQEHFNSFEKLDITFKELDIKIHASGEVAWLSCILNANLLNQGQQGSINDLRVTWVLEKQNQNWVIVHAHFSLPQVK
jgi:uncharacterized protein (TIGR02246 family)